MNAAVMIRRRFRRTRDPARIMRARLGLTVIPANLVTGMSRSMNLNLSTAENLLNRRPGDWSSPQSPDELVIQKRGRRRNIIWSPDLDAHKRHDLLSLSSRDRTPVKNPSPSDIALRNTPRKRLSFIDTRQSEFTTPEKKIVPSCSPMWPATNTPQKQSVTDLETGLRGLSQHQLVEMIMDLVRMQEDGTLSENEKLRNILLRKMPVAALQPLIHKLHVLRQLAVSTLTDSESNETAHKCASLHLDLFKNALLKQGEMLEESQHWESLIRYSLIAWGLTREFPTWNSYDYHRNINDCYKILLHFCVQALKRQKFEIRNLEAFIMSFEHISKVCEEFRICLQMAKEARHKII